jgi:hypothetical protein
VAGPAAKSVRLKAPSPRAHSTLVGCGPRPEPKCRASSEQLTPDGARETLSLLPVPDPQPLADLCHEIAHTASLRLRGRAGAATPSGPRCSSCAVSRTRGASSPMVRPHSEQSCLGHLSRLRAGRRVGRSTRGQRIACHLGIRQPAARVGSVSPLNPGRTLGRGLKRRSREVEENRNPARILGLGGVSSVGRAPALQAGGRRFEPGTLHLRKPLQMAAFFVL